MNMLYKILMLGLLIGFVFTANASNAEPVAVSNWSELDEVRNDLDGDYILTADLDQESDGYEGIGDSWSPIEEFSGTFDGDGYTISDLVSEEGGLFGEIDGAVVSNVGIVNADISGDDDNIGVLVNWAHNGSLIENSFATGDLVASGRSSHGGLLGRTDDVETTIRQSWANVDVTVTYESDDHDARWTGGLAGYIREGLIEDSYALGDVNSPGEQVGGLAGRVGLSNTQGVTINSFSTGQVSGDDAVGGLIGGLGAEDAGSEVIASFWDTETSGMDESDGGEGLSTTDMQDGMTFAAAGWDMVTTNSPEATWGINPDHNNGYPFLTWQGYDAVPIEIVFAGGFGTEDDPYQIENWEHLNNIRNYLDQHFILTANLDEDTEYYDEYNSEEGWLPIGDFSDNPFTGVFDGDGYTISDLSIQDDGNTYGGLFAYIEEAVVKDLGILNADILGSHHQGILTGRADDSEITRVYSTGSVESTGTVNIAGLVGSLRDGGVIDQSWSNADISVTIHDGDRRNTGGLVGYVTDGAEVTNSYAHGSVEGGRRVGGLVGLVSSESLIYNSYATATAVGDEDDIGGLIGYITESDESGSFWDVEVSGNDESSAGTGLSTEEMKDGQTFVDADWDFMLRPFEEAIWGINPDDNDGYPFLAWQGYTPESLVPAFAAGDGTEDDPYQIESWEHLNNVRDYLDQHFVLTTDLDQDSEFYDEFNSGQGWLPIGDFSDNPFTGVFDGDGYTISDLSIQDEDNTYGGLFAYIVEGVVKDLGLLNADILGSHHQGILTGRADNSEILRVYSTGSVESTGTVNIGGLAGSLREDGVIDQSWSDVDVSVTVHEGDRRNAGALVGYVTDGAEVTNSYAYGSVEGGRRVGGLVGLVSSESLIYNSFATASASGDEDDIGGLIGYITESTETGSFWDVEVSGNDESSAGTGLSTEEMQMMSTFLDAGWDFIGEGEQEIWGINPDVNQGYPFLAWQGYEHAPDDVVDVIEIASWSDLHDVRNDLEAHYVLTTDLDRNSEGYEDYNLVIVDDGWESIAEFTGTFDGNGYTISDLSSEIGGLFEEIKDGATIKNLGLINANIYSPTHNAGILVDWAHGGALIENSFSTGSLIASDRNSHGGLVGRTDDEATTIRESWSSADVTATYEREDNNSRWTGALVGYVREGLVENSYATGNVESQGDRVGGLVGQLGLSTTQGILKNSYSTGEVSGLDDVGGLIGGFGGEDGGSEITASFWDTESSGMDESNGGEGLTTGEMKTESIFTDADWDFDNVWEMDSEINYGYPHLRNSVHTDVPVPSEITFANIVWPDEGEIEEGEEFDVFGRVQIGRPFDDHDSDDIQAWVGYNEEDVGPDAEGWTWVEADLNPEYDGFGHEYMAEIGSGLEDGSYYYMSRFQYEDQDYEYGGYDRGFWDGETNISGRLTVIGPTDAEQISDVPDEFGLDQNYPNPFNPVTTINYQVPESEHVTIQVYNVIGERVATLVNEVQDAGHHSVEFDGSRFASGVYIYRMQAGDFVDVRKLTLTK
ncbi:T9SS type A sorting domain-containing protein [Natronogracilivirgula saccharolytica]|uniref:T9SS type A sorting domain-containing protein n=2 Tax=Natronogracilivirga saccharolytica TaxID=2812953 RepID=A0A8J7UY26_9BACT|nr:T9SS type A sorting domain-containing protein [Natronogracilivirga saccharolytica]